MYVWDGGRERMSVCVGMCDRAREIEIINLDCIKDFSLVGKIFVIFVIIQN